jgi:hypothetical protein
MERTEVMKTLLKSTLATALFGAAALGVGCVAQPADPVADEPIASVKQDLSGGYWFSWGGTMNSAGTAYNDGYPYWIDLGVPENGWTCMLTGIRGNLTNVPNFGAELFINSATSNWSLGAHAAPGNSSSAAAVCFPATGQQWVGWWDAPSRTLTSNQDPSQEACGFMQVTGVIGTPATITVSDNGSNPNVNPLGGPTWSFNRNSNINAVTPMCSWATYSSWWNWEIIGGTAHETMPLGTSCFLTSFSGNLETNSFSNGAWATVNSSTGEWTFTAASGVTAWWLCLN